MICESPKSMRQRSESGEGSLGSKILGRENGQWHITDIHIFHQNIGNSAPRKKYLNRKFSGLISRCATLISALDRKTNALSIILTYLKECEREEAITTIHHNHTSTKPPNPADRPSQRPTPHRLTCTHHSLLFWPSLPPFSALRPPPALHIPGIFRLFLPRSCHCCGHSSVPPLGSLLTRIFRTAYAARWMAGRGAVTCWF